VLTVIILLPNKNTKIMNKKYKDPNNINQHAPGAKLDADKIRAGLVIGGFSHALRSVAAVGTFGAKKYSDNG
jgi:hypothetical protein